ncbi:elongation of very long chain fatty acids protein AAEL008004-like [Anthonomus grandis grandis]|uniref:elongation of very long chain fatty acids protein AAEL008004-like n=1 Tax=Anthonomus grandis grandis TaxID=2921223 RepID=UPI0021658529|nr:elongation of very long chain fatty acids protein AAEL008004-like [Anthonomus grandis grandis]
MAYLLKTMYDGYFYILNEKSDPRANDYFLLQSPIPTAIVLFLWYKFVFKWGPALMEKRPPYNLKRIMIIYNIIQILANSFIVLNCLRAIHFISWTCNPIDYSESYWGRQFLQYCYIYYLLKMADLIDTVFFVLRKKQTHISFLHTYHHFGMVMTGWYGAKFVGGGHSYFLGFANCIVHTILYSYYLLTALDSKYGKILWLKKFITQAQLFQFVFLFYMYVQLLWVDCDYPKGILFLFVPQNLFMIVLFSDFYVRTYILAPRKKRKLQEEAERMKDEREKEEIKQAEMK